MHPLVAFVQDRLAAAADPEKAGPMAAYMKSDMPFYGVQATPRRAIARDAYHVFPLPDRAVYEDVLRTLWAQPHREEKYLALDLAARYRAHRVPASLPFYEHLIRDGAWWDLVDPAATNLVGATLLAHPEAVWPTLDAWIEDPDLWIRRTAIICQLKHRDRTDVARLFGYCLDQAHETDFFIRKAIGWALRQYARTAPEAVRAFVEAHRSELSPLSIREATRHL